MTRYNDIPKKIKIKSQVIVILTDKKKNIVTRKESHNIITNDGDKYYAQRGAGETPDNSFNSLYLGSTASPSPQKTSNYSSITPIAGTEKLIKTGYPKTNDTDTDNTGPGIDIITWIFEYATTDGNWSSITEAGVSIAGASGTTALLNHFSFSGGAFSKDSNTTLKVIINHEVLGT